MVDADEPCEGRQESGARVSFTVITAPQRSSEWFAARLGRVTGTAASDVLATIKSGEAAARRDLRARLVAERLSQTPQEDVFVNEAMAWGVAHEDEARIAYELHSGFQVQETGFLAHNDLMAGVSLDGHIGDYVGLIEIKAPKTATHLQTLREGIPARHMAQLTHALWMVPQADYLDFVSYDPRLPERLRLVVHRVMRHDVDVTGYGMKLLKFLEEVDAEVAALRTMANLGAVLTASLER